MLILPFYKKNQVWSKGAKGQENILYYVAIVLSDDVDNGYNFFYLSKILPTLIQTGFSMKILGL